MTEGLGLSEEIFQAAETGSGFSGRKIPETAVRGILTQVVYWLVHDADRQIIRPLVRQHGLEGDYTIIPFGLIEEDNGNVEPTDENVPGEAANNVDKPKMQLASATTQRDPNKGNGLRLAC